MQRETLEQALNIAPFRPFDIHIDGRTIPVLHPDQVLFNRSRDTVVVAPEDDRFHIMDVAEIQFLSVHRPHGRKPAARRK